MSAYTSRAGAAEHWTSLATPHFEMYTTNGEKQGTAALRVFEQVRYFFLQAGNSKSTPEQPVRIIAFQSEKQYRPYRLNEGAFAYYLRTRKVDYIVMQDISPEHYQSAVHEYTHLIIEHLELKLPVWLNEGLADVYSSLESHGNKALVGRPLAGRAAELQHQHWLDLDQLFAVDAASPYYNERDKMSIFYAQSWALTHMLALSPLYRPHFHQFVGAISGGRPAADCFLSIYGKTLPQVTQDLHRYLGQASVQGALFDVKLNQTDLDPQVAPASDFKVELALTDLLASQKRTRSEAAQQLAQLAQQHPESPEVPESLGYLAWEDGDVAKAREDFRLAFERGSADPEMMVHYATLLGSAGTPPDQIVPILRKAVVIKPDLPDGWFDLGMTAMNAHKWGIALNALSRITTVKPDRAYALFSALAYCDAQLKDPKEARVMAERAKPYAKTPEQSFQLSSLLRYLDSLEQTGSPNQVAAANPSAANPPTPVPAEERPRPTGQPPRDLPRDVPSLHWDGPIARVEAVAKYFDCAAKPPRLRVSAGTKEMVFELDDPDGVVVRNRPNGVLDLSCGPQKSFPVGIFYLQSSPPSPTDGKIRELVF